MPLRAKSGSEARGPREAASSAQVCSVGVVHLEALKRVLVSMPPVDELARVTELFALLASETRLRILLALAHEELCVCDIAEAVGQSVSATSHQLRSLRQVGLVQHRSEGKLVFYRLCDVDVGSVIARAREVVA